MNAEGFFQELNKLISSFPKLPGHVFDSEDCYFCDYVYWSKNARYCFDLAKSSDCLYVYDSILCANCVDCDYAAECELCYESENPFKCFNCNYISDCANLNDSFYCIDCANGRHLFGCLHLRNKSFCIFNRQFTEAEYEEKVSKLKGLPAEKILRFLSEMEKSYPRTQTFSGSNINTEYGNYIYQNKNCYLCFDAYKNEESAYLYDCANNAACLNMTYSYESNLSYELVDCDRMFNSNFAVFCDNCRDSQYLFRCINCKDCLGCVYLKHKQYCILNRQFTKEEYDKLSGGILANLNKNNVGWDALRF